MTMQPSHEDKIFTPFSMPVSRLPETFANTYKLVGPDGRESIVEAGSASEAVIKSGITDPRYIVNVAYERGKLLEKHVLRPAGQNVLTNIHLEETSSSLGMMILDTLKEDDTPKEEF